jgi:anti-sigma regulatory factor (Ser/Thr protein kinase)
LPTHAVTPTPDGVGAARRWSRRQVPTSWPTSEADRLETVVGELVANAVEHGVPPVELRVTARPDGAARIVVRDRGSGPQLPVRGPAPDLVAPAPDPDAPAPDPDAPAPGPAATPERGHGLALVAAVATLAASRDAAGCEVVADLRARSEPPDRTS